MQRGPSSSLLPVNPFDPRTRPDPYPIYQYMRAVEPVHKSPVGFWILTRYADCRAALEDKRWSHNADRILEPGRGPVDPVDPTVRLLRASVAFADGTRHKSHMRPLEAAVRKASVKAGPRAKKVAGDLIQLMREKKTKVDLMRDFARPLSLVVIADMLGLPAPDRGEVFRWSRELATGLDPSVRSVGVIKASAAATAMIEYLLDRLEDEPQAASRGVIADLSASRGKLRTWEVVADLAALLVIGLEATAGLIGNGMLALARNPEQMKKLAAEPALMESALEELARFDGPVHLTARVAAEEVEIGGKKIAAGELVIVLLAAANRDGAHFTDPDTLNLARQGNDHLGFGAGSHACFAASTARLLAGTAINSLLAELDDIELAGEPGWNDSVTLRGLSHLPITFRT